MSKQIYVTGHTCPDTDSIAAAISYSYLKRQLGMDAIAVRAGEINKESAFALDHFGMEAPKLVASVARVNEEEEKQKVILVDHNESKQCINGIGDAEVLEVIDHHRLGDLETENPIFILIRPVGCVNTVIYGLYQQYGVEIPKRIAGMMLSAVISDTVLFRSPTTTDPDREAVKALAEIAGVDYEAYGMEMLKAGADISDYPAAKLAGNDTKEFEAAGKVFTVGQISVMDTAPIEAKKSEILSELEAVRASKGYAASFLMVTDILKEDTDLWYTDGADAVVKAAFGKETKDHHVYLPGVMSRKKQITPNLLKAYGK